MCARGSDSREGADGKPDELARRMRVKLSSVRDQDGKKAEDEHESKARRKRPVQCSAAKPQELALGTWSLSHTKTPTRTDSNLQQPARQPHVGICLSRTSGLNGLSGGVGGAEEKPSTA